MKGSTNLISVLLERRFKRRRADSEANPGPRVSDRRQEARRRPAENQRVHRGFVGVSREDHHALTFSASLDAAADAAAARSPGERWPGTRVVPLHAGDDRR